MLSTNLFRDTWLYLTNLHSVCRYTCHSFPRMIYVILLGEPDPTKKFFFFINNTAPLLLRGQFLSSFRVSARGSRLKKSCEQSFVIWPGCVYFTDDFYKLSFVHRVYDASFFLPWLSRWVFRLIEKRTSFLRTFLLRPGRVTLFFFEPCVPLTVLANSLHDYLNKLL